MDGWIKLFRNLLNWEWYNDIYVKAVFIHLLLTANYEDKKWHGIDVKRGQVLTSRKHLSNDLNLSEQKIRTALKKLEKTKEITIKTTNQYSLITIENYSIYQNKEEKVTNEITNEIENENQPSNNQQLNQQSTNNLTNNTTNKKGNEELERVVKEENNNIKATNEITNDNFENQPSNIQKVNHNIRNKELKNKEILSILSIYSKDHKHIENKNLDEMMDENEKMDFECILKKCELHVLTPELAVEITEILKEMYISLDTREKVQELNSKKILYALKNFAIANTKTRIQIPKQYFKKCVISALDQTELSTQYDTDTIYEMGE